MYVQVAFANEVETHPESFRAHLDASERCLRRFLHHVAKFAGERNRATAFDEGRLDLQYLSTHLGPRQAGSQTNFAFRRNALLTELNRSEHLLHAFGVDDIFDACLDGFTDEFAR